MLVQSWRRVVADSLHRKTQKHIKIYAFTRRVSKLKHANFTLTLRQPHAAEIAALSLGKSWDYSPFCIFWWGSFVQVWPPKASLGSQSSWTIMSTKPGMSSCSRNPVKPASFWFLSTQASCASIKVAASVDVMEVTNKAPTRIRTVAYTTSHLSAPSITHCIPNPPKKQFTYTNSLLWEYFAVIGGVIPPKRDKRRRCNFSWKLCLLNPTNYLVYRRCNWYTN